MAIEMTMHNYYVFTFKKKLPAARMLYVHSGVWVRVLCVKL